MKEDEEENLGDDPWLLFTLTSADPIKFQPKTTFVDDSKFLQFIRRNPQKFDYIFVGFEAHTMLKQNVEEIAKIMKEQTIVLVDVDNNPWAFSEVDDLFDYNPVVSLHSSIDCRLLNKSRISLQLFNVHDLNIKIGLVEDSDKQINHSCLEYGGQLDYLQEIYSKFHDHQYSVELVPLHSNGKLIKSIWKGIISLVCFHILTVVFGDPDVKTLDAHDSRYCFLNGIFEEILQIASHLKVTIVPKPFTSGADKLLKFLEISEGFQKMKRAALVTNNYFPEFIDANKLFYDFSQDLPVNVNDILLKLLNISHHANINTPYISTIHTVFNVLLSIRDDNSKLFQSKKSFNLTQLNVVNEISPTQNMMNFPPFNPLPAPTNPIVFVSEFKQDSPPVEEDETSSVDSDLQELISGTEHLTYGEYEDAKSSLPLQQPPPPPPIPPIPVAAHTSPYPYGPGPYGSTPELPQQFLQHPMYGYPFPYPPQHPFMMSQSKYPPPRPPPGQLPDYPYEPHHVKKKVYNPPFPIGKHTNAHYLLQSHTEVLDAVKFDGLMNNTTSSRYGDLDTTTVVLNSANNSRGSKSSVMSLPKLERKHKKDKRKFT